MYPWDLDHFHLALETYPLPPSILAQMDVLGVVRESVVGKPLSTVQAATCQLLVNLLNSAYGFLNDTPFMLFHTYELTRTFSPAYMDSSATAYLMPGDPTRSIRWTFPHDQYPWLTYPGQETNSEFRNGPHASPQQIWQIGFFVDRKGRVVLLLDFIEWFKNCIYQDALREE